MGASTSHKLHYAVFWFLGISWGSNFLFMKIAVQAIPPLQVVLLRMIFGALPIVAYGLYRRVMKRADFRYVHHFIAMGLINTIVPAFGFVKGTQYLPSGVTGALAGSIPLMTAVLATLLLGDRLTPRKVAGLLLGCFGAMLVAQIGTLLEGNAQDILKGTLFTLLGCLGYAAAMVYARRFITPLGLSPVALAAYQMIFAVVIIALLVPADGIGGIMQHTDALLAVVIGLGLFGTGLAFIAYYYIIEHLGAAVSSSVFYVPPMVALLIGALVAGEWIAPLQFAGAGLILLGVYLAKSGGRRDAQKTG